MANNTTEKVLQATIKLKDEYTRPITKVIQTNNKFTTTLLKISKKPIMIKALDKASPIINKVKAMTDKLKATKQYQLYLKMQDMASKPIQKAISLAKSFAKGSFKAVVGVKDNASNVLNKLKSTLGLLGAGITIGVAVNSTVGEAMDLEAQKASIQFWNGKNGASKKEGNDFIKSLDKIDSSSLYDTNEIYATGSRALGVTGNAKEAERYVKLSQNMAMAIPGKTMGDAIEALADAKNGEWERLKEFNFKGSADTDPAVLFKQMEERFGGASEAKKGTSTEAFQKSKKNLKKNLSSLGTELLPTVTPMLNSIGNTLVKLTPYFVNAGKWINDFFNKFQKSNEAKVLLDLFKTVSQNAFSAIGDYIENCRPFIEKVFNFLIQNLPIIKLFIETVASVWKAFWKTAGPLLDSAWKFIQPCLQGAIDLLSGLLTFIKDIATWWSNMADKINKNPIVATIKKVTGSKSDDKDDEKTTRNAFGSGRIARNGELHELHEGEKILTKNQASQYEKSQGDSPINIYMNNTVIREEADITKFTKALVKELKIQKNVIVGG